MPPNVSGKPEYSLCVVSWCPPVVKLIQGRVARGRKAKNTNMEATLPGNTNIGATQAGNTNSGEGDTNIGAILGPRDNRDDGARALQYTACSTVQCRALLHSTV